MLLEATVAISQRDDVGELILARPTKLNAINGAMRDEIRAALAAFAADERVSAVVVSGLGSAFSSGQDLTEIATIDEAGARIWVDQLGELYQAVRSFPKPLVAAVNGLAAGAGLQVALHADLRIGCEATVFAQTEISVGLPSVLGAWVMNRIMGIGPTLDMCLSGRHVDAEEAIKLGLLHRIVSSDKLIGEAMEVAARLGQMSKMAIEQTKQWIAQIDGCSFSEMLDVASGIMGSAFASGIPQREISRFQERRGPRNA